MKHPKRIFCTTLMFLMIPNLGYPQDVIDLQDIIDLNKKLTALEERVSGFQKFQFLLASFIGLIVASFTLRRILEEFFFKPESVQDKIDAKFEEAEKRNSKIVERLQSVIEKQENRMDELNYRVGENIEKSTTLLGRFSDILKVRDEADAIIDRVGEAENARESVRIRVLDEINQRAYDLASNMDTKNCAVPQKQHELFGVKNDFDAAKVEYAASTKEFNAFVNLCIGFSLRSGNTKARLDSLSEGIAKCKAEQSSTDIRLYPDIDEYKIPNALRLCEYKSWFHRGILLYNIEKYSEAIDSFQNAKSIMPKFLSPDLYILESKALSTRSNPTSKLESDFEDLVHKVEGGEFSTSEIQDPNEFLAEVLVRFGNLFFARGDDSESSRTYDPRKALSKYSEANDADPNSYLATFSHAQALVRCKNEGFDSKSNPQQASALFRKSFDIIVNKITQTSESRVKVMLYYMASICAIFGRNDRELAKSFLPQIVGEVSELNYRKETKIYSPTAKAVLSIEDFMSEVREFSTRLTTIEGNLP